MDGLFDPECRVPYPLTIDPLAPAGFGKLGGKGTCMVALGFSDVAPTVVEWHADAGIFVLGPLDVATCGGAPANAVPGIDGELVGPVRGAAFLALAARAGFHQGGAIQQ